MAILLYVALEDLGGGVAQSRAQASGTSGCR